MVDAGAAAVWAVVVGGRGVVGAAMLDTAGAGTVEATGAACAGERGYGAERGYGRIYWQLFKRYRGGVEDGWE